MNFPNSAGRINLTFEFEGYCFGGGGVFVLGMCVLGGEFRNSLSNTQMYVSSCYKFLHVQIQFLIIIGIGFTRSQYNCDTHLMTPTDGDNT